MKNIYVHGFNRTEQERLVFQANLLEDDLYKGIDLHNTKHLLEVGVGVGAQTSILIKRFPHLKITGIDLSEKQLKFARKRLSKEIKKEKVRLIHLNAEKVNQLDGSYDGAFLCWFLEHVPDPVKILKAIHKKINKGSKIYITEVMNAGFFLDPYSPAILKYWFEFNDFQWYSGGNPFMGARLGNHLVECGYKNIDIEPRTFFYDSRDTLHRNKFLTDMEQIMLSAAPHLVKEKRVGVKDIQNIKKEFLKLRKNKKSVVHLDYIRAIARK